MSTPVYHEVKCLDCDHYTLVADNEPEENQRCIKHWIQYLKESQQ